MITVQHDTMCEFFDELRPHDVHAGVLRVCGYTEDVSEELSHVFLKAGCMFKNDGVYELRELHVYVGDDTPTDNEGTNNFETMLVTLGENTQRLGLELMGGEYA